MTRALHWRERRRRWARVLVIGGGGREHAILFQLSKSSHVARLYGAPGNAGTAKVPRCKNLALSLDPKKFGHILAAVRRYGIDLVVVGPEVPLAQGLADMLRAHGISVVGHSAEATKIESSKSFGKEVMAQAGIPTAESQSFTDLATALDYLQTCDFPVVIKGDGLAAGKAVTICYTLEEAEQALRALMEDRVLGAAGDTVIIEEYLRGEEVSAIALTDGETVVLLHLSRDHKPVGEGNTGPNTGGMGAYTLKDEQLAEEVKTIILEPAVRTMAKRGTPLCGVLYAGLMVTASGPKVLEFNARLGDPETEVILPLLDDETDLFELLYATARGELADIPEPRWKSKVCLGVVLVSDGYPSKYETGYEIPGLDDELPDNVLVFHMGTKKQGRLTLTAGGRVLMVVAIADTLEEARTLVYEFIERVKFKNAYFRRDIGRKAA